MRRKAAVELSLRSDDVLRTYDSFAVDSAATVENKTASDNTPPDEGHTQVCCKFFNGKMIISAYKSVRLAAATSMQMK